MTREKLKEILKREVRKVLSESPEPQPLPQKSKPAPAKPSVEPDVMEPGTKPDVKPKRRTLQPPKESPDTKPKASLSEDEQKIVDKITARFKELNNG